ERSPDRCGLSAVCAAGITWQIDAPATIVELGGPLNTRSLTRTKLLKVARDRCAGCARSRAHRRCARNPRRAASVGRAIRRLPQILLQVQSRRRFQPARTADI